MARTAALRGRGGSGSWSVLKPVKRRFPVCSKPVLTSALTQYDFCRGPAFVHVSLVGRVDRTRVLTRFLPQFQWLQALRARDQYVLCRRGLPYGHQDQGGSTASIVDCHYGASHAPISPKRLPISCSSSLPLGPSV